MKSVNGWSVISSSQLNRNKFPGTNIVPVPGVRSGDVATVLHYVGSQFNKKVEKLVNPGCWGWARRNIIGFFRISNHASGTAIDLNAPRHPLGSKNTFSVSQRVEIRKILKYCDGVVRWGGDYPGRKDDMHFEIVGNSAQVAKLAKKIKQGGRRYKIVRKNEGADDIAKRAGYKDYDTISRQNYIAKLNGYKDWRAFNKGVKRGQRVRVA